MYVEAKAIKGGIAEDERGSLSFYNEFALEGCKRMYVVTSPRGVIRGWHGHQREHKYIVCTSGDIVVNVIHPKEWAGLNKVERFALTAKRPEVLHVPAMCAHGWTPLSDEATVLFLSTATLDESAPDDYRWPIEQWPAVWTRRSF